MINIKHSRRLLIRSFLRLFLGIYLGCLWVATILGPKKRQTRDGRQEVLLTGTFYSENWLTAHLRPLAMSPQCARLRVVSTWPIPQLENVEPIYPAPWLIRLVGTVLARLLTFIWVAVRTRPHVVGGFHLLFNGLLIGLVARCIGARSLYFCVGGPTEILNGGIGSENRLFEQLEVADPVIEQQLLRAVRALDLIVVMGGNTAKFFQQIGLTVPVHIISGGIDRGRFSIVDTPPESDLIIVCRLAPIKRVDLFLRAIYHVKQSFPSITATIVGDGALRASLEQLTRELNLQESVSFVGHQQNVTQWLQRARIFVLTSDSEALPLSTMEAMMCGLPVVVSAVGDLADLVQDGVNGYLVKDRSAEAFAARILELVINPERQSAFSKAARAAAERYEMHAASRLWDNVLNDATRTSGTLRNSNGILQESIR